KSVTIFDAPLSPNGKNITATEGTPFTKVVASFTDADPSAVASYFTATIDWGDNTATSAGTVSANAQGGFDITGTHAYPRAGGFSISVQINDVGGSTTTAPSFASV